MAYIALFSGLFAREMRIKIHILLVGATKEHLSDLKEGGKLNPRYTGPFEILERVGTLACRITMPPNLSKYTIESSLKRRSPDLVLIFAGSY